VLTAALAQSAYMIYLIQNILVSSSDSRETEKENSLSTRRFVSLVQIVADCFVDSVDAKLGAFGAARVRVTQTRPACSIWVM
jgi:hypothetical protein